MASTAVVKRAAKNQAVSEVVVSAVAEFTGLEPDELEPLYHTVDPDALDVLFGDDGRAPDQVAFTYSDCDVVVTTTGVVQVSKSGVDSQTAILGTDNVRS